MSHRFHFKDLHFIPEIAASQFAVQFDIKAFVQGGAICEMRHSGMFLTMLSLKSNSTWGNGLKEQQKVIFIE